MNEHDKLLSGLQKTLSSTKAQLQSPTYVAEIICEIGIAPGLPFPYDKIGNQIEGLVQVPTQLADALVYLSDFPIRSYLELGVSFGWTASFVTAYLFVFNPEIQAKAVDMQPCFSSYEAVRRILPIEFVLGSAADFKGDGADLCFIDADHSYSAAKADYLNLGRLCRFCMFHDIHDDRANQNDPDGGCRRVWQEINRCSASVKEWRGSLAGDNVMGIGLIQHH